MNSNLSQINANINNSKILYLYVKRKKVLDDSILILKNY